jgi:hypothetical protein
VELRYRYQCTRAEVVMGVAVVAALSGVVVIEVALL